jgi:hypothetical protein
MVNTPASYSGARGIKSRIWYRVSSQRFSWFSSVPPSECQDNSVKLGHDHLLPSRLVYNSLTTPYVVSGTEKAWLKKLQSMKIQRAFFNYKLIKNEMYGLRCMLKYICCSLKCVLAVGWLVIFRIFFWDVLPCKMIVDRRFRDDGGSTQPLKRRSTIILHWSTSQKTILNKS